MFRWYARCRYVADLLIAFGLGALCALLLVGFVMLTS